MIKVQFGQLTKPLKEIMISTGSTVQSFCEKQNIKFGAHIRVNGRTVDRRTILRANDIITSIDNVDGGN
jgi:hypothetical protein